MSEIIAFIRDSSPDRCGSIGWVSLHKAKGCQLNSRSGYMPGLRVWSLATDQYFSPSFSLSLPLSLVNKFFKKFFKERDSRNLSYTLLAT